MIFTWFQYATFGIGGCCYSMRCRSWRGCRHTYIYIYIYLFNFFISDSFFPHDTSIIKQSSPTILHNPSHSPPNIAKGEAIPINPNGVQCGASREKPKERKKERQLDVVTDMNYGVASFSNWSKSICTPKTGIVRGKGPLKTLASFLVWTPQMIVDKPTDTYLSEGKPLGYYIIGWIFWFTPIPPSWLDGPCVGRVHWKSSATKVVRSSTILASSDLPQGSHEIWPNAWV